MNEKAKDDADWEAEARKRRVKKLVYANLVGASLLSVAGFSASAHGNASSHLASRISWNVDSFTVDHAAGQTHKTGQAEQVAAP